MRLIDKIVQTCEPFIVELHGEILTMPGAGDFADEIRATPLRYVVDDSVRRVCGELIQRWPDLLDPSDPHLRLTAQKLWVEWIEEPGQQVGVLIRTTPDGRTGTVHSFWSDEYGAVPAQAAVCFDFDNSIHRGATPSTDTALDCHSLPAVVAAAVTVDIDPRWEDYFARSRRDPEVRSAALNHCAGLVLADFPFILAFSRLLQAPENFDALPVSRETLNVSRRKRNRPELLDHIEVSLRFGSPRSKPSDREAFNGAHCRRHLVRGHFVRRFGNVFWRSSHYRGSSKPTDLLSRTVNASMAKSLKGVELDIEAVSTGDRAGWFSQR